MPRLDYELAGSSSHWNFTTSGDYILSARQVAEMQKKLIKIPEAILSLLISL